MRIWLTGGTGYIGSAVLRELWEHGHEVVALVRSDESAAKVAAAGATPVLGDLLDTDWTAAQLATVDGAIHTASPGGSGSAAFDTAMARAAVRAYAGTSKPYVHTGGIWSYGSGTGITDDSPLARPALSRWRETSESVVLGSDLVATVMVPGMVYGHGGGIVPGVIVDAPRTSDGALTLVGDGRQHWVTVHVDDLAALYVEVLLSGQRLGRVLGAGPDAATVRELAEATGSAVVAEPVEATRERLGADYADALLLDQQVVAEKALALGWAARRPSAVAELQAATQLRAG